MLNEREIFDAKISWRYTDIVISMLGYFNLNHPVYINTLFIITAPEHQDASCLGCGGIESYVLLFHIFVRCTSMGVSKTSCPYTYDTVYSYTRVWQTPSKFTDSLITYLWRIITAVILEDTTQMTNTGWREITRIYWWWTHYNNKPTTVHATWRRDSIAQQIGCTQMRISRMYEECSDLSLTV